MLYTFGQAKTRLKAYVDDGSCSSTVISRRINEALERLNDMHSWEHIRRIVRFSIHNGVFALPYNVESVISASINTEPAMIFSRAYQFMPGGPGDLDAKLSNGTFTDIVDMGDGWPTMFDIPHTYQDTEDVTVATDGLKIAAFSSTPQPNATFTVRGFDHHGNEIRNGGLSGESLTINTWKGGQEGELEGHWDMDIVPSTSGFAEVSRVIIEDTTDYISLYAVDTLRNLFFFLGKYHPNQTVPQFRRYRINRSGYLCNNILALVRMRYVPLISDEDVLPYDSLQPVKLMLMALTEENSKNMQGALNYESKAMQLLESRQKAKAENSTGVKISLQYRQGLGRGLNKRIIL